MCSVLRLLAEERPVDLLPVGAAPSGAGGVGFSLHIQTRLSKQVLQGPTLQTAEVKKKKRKTTIFRSLSTIFLRKIPKIENSTS